MENGITEIKVKAYDEITGQIVDAKAVDIRISKQTDKLRQLYFTGGNTISCTDTHLFMDDAGQFIPAADIQEGQILYGGLKVIRAFMQNLPTPLPVYDMTVPEHFNFILENGVIVHNSGKSFSAKREITNVILITKDDVAICDPEGEYSPLVNKLQRYRV